MIYSTKKDQYWSFWCQGWSDHHDQEFLGNRAGESNEFAEAAEFNEVAKVFRDLKTTFEDFKAVQVLELYDLRKNFNVLKKIFFERIMKIPLNFSNFSFGGWWGQPISLFWKLVDETQIGTLRKYTDAFIIIKKLFLGGLRGLQSDSIWYEIPCISKIPRKTTKYLQAR